MLNILAFSDTHGSSAAARKLKEKAKDADLLVCAGDISIFGMDLRKILLEYSGFGKPMLVIAGNHEIDDDLRKHAKRLENIIHVEDAIFSFGNYHFLCSSGNGFSHEDKAFEMVSESFYHLMKKISHADGGQVFVLVTHAPPYKTRLDEVMGGHSGNKAVRRFIQKAKPKLAICGHIHENKGKKDAIGNTRIVNPGPEGMLIRI